MLASYAVLFAAALVCSACGFYKYVYFISIGYGAAIAGQAAVMLALSGVGRAGWMALPAALLIVYGIRLAGYLAVREWKSASYRRHMATEIKDGSTMTFFVKCMLWIFCGLLYLMMVSPVFFRIFAGKTAPDAALWAGTLLMVLGIALESAADISKNRQKKQAPKRFCDKGLFRLVRCPNYLGELILWTGVFVTGLTAGNNAWMWAADILGYLGIVFVMFSGARRLEVRQNRNYGSDPEYRAYVKRVPILLPFVPLYSVEKYKFLIL